MAYLQAVRVEAHFSPVNAPQGQVLCAQTLQGVSRSCNYGSTWHLDQPCLVETRQEAWQGQRPLLLLCLLLLLLCLLLWSLLLWCLLHILPADHCHLARLHWSCILLLLLGRKVRCRGSTAGWGCCILHRCSLVVLRLLLLYWRWLSIGTCVHVGTVEMMPLCSSAHSHLQAGKKDRARPVPYCAAGGEGGGP